jgi:DNA-binding GntR family transcriptional regulator
MENNNRITGKNGKSDKKLEASSFSIPKSLSQSIYRYLENMIISGKMGPGERLLPDEIADTLKVSKSPVREALLRLEKEGLVANLPRIGFYVADINIDDIEEIYPIRMVLFSLLARTIIESGYETEFMDRVDGYIEEMAQYVNKGDVDGYFTVNIKLYDCYCTYCPNSRLRAMVNQVAKPVMRFRLLGMKPPGRLQRSFELNSALAKAIKDKDSGAASELAAQIVYEGLIALRKVLQNT